MGKIGKVWILSIAIFLILAIFWAINFPVTSSVLLDQSADEALIASEVTIFENYNRSVQIKINETDINKTILCSNLDTFIKEVGNGTVIKDVEVSGYGRLTITTRYLHPRLASNCSLYSKPTAVVKYITTKTISVPDYYESGSVASVSASEVRISRSAIMIIIGVVAWTIFFASLSGFLLLMAEGCWGKCRNSGQKAASAIKKLKSKKSE